MIFVDFAKVKKSGVKAILLDLDNTLYKYEPCHQYALKSCWQIYFKKNNLIFSQFKKDYELAKKEVKKDTFGQASSHSRFLYFQKLLEKKLGRTDVNLIVKLEKCYWLNFFKQMKLRKGVFSFFKECKKNNIKICLITDLTAQIQFEKIKFLKIGKYLNFIVSSEEAGREKPNKAIFSLALRKLKMRPNEVILIGDDYDRDFIGARNFKIKTINAYV